MIPSNIVKWDARHNNADIDYFKTPILQGTLKTQNQHQEEFCGFSEDEHLLDVQERDFVSHSSTEAELVFLDAGSRMDGLPALDLWDLVKEVFHSSPTHRKPKIKHEETRRVTPHQTSTPKTKLKTRPSTSILSNIDFTS